MFASSESYRSRVWGEATRDFWSRGRAAWFGVSIAVGFALWVFEPLAGYRAVLAFAAPLGFLLVYLAYRLARAPGDLSRGDAEWYAAEVERLETMVASDAATLKGKWFHTVDERGDIHLQGQVLRDEGERLFVQLFDFMMGDPSDQRYLTPDEAAQLRAYDTNRAMKTAYRRHHPELRD